MKSASEKLSARARLLEALAWEGNPNSITDVGVGALCIHTAIEGATLNVKVNLSGIDDKQFGEDLLAKVEDYRQRSAGRREKVLKIVEGKL